MLLRQSELEAIAAGRVTLALRRWKRPTVRTGGTLLTAIGQLAIESLERIEAIAPEDAAAAGFGSLEAAMRSLVGRRGDLYRIRLRLAAPDPRLALRESADLDAAAHRQIGKRLARYDAAGKSGPWTAATLAAISAHPGVSARELAVHLGRERDTLKADIRKLKAMGLTISLETGYRLSPRGMAWLNKT